VPVTRDQAVQLEAQLEEALPPGAILASQQQHVASWQRQQQRHWTQQLSQQADILQHFQQQLADQKQERVQLHGQSEELPGCDVLAPELTLQHQQMDGLLKEAAQQVGAAPQPYGLV
jgi:transposase